MDVSNNNEKYTKVKSNGNIYPSDNNLSVLLSSTGTPVDDSHTLKKICCQTQKKRPKRVWADRKMN